ncbi:MAG: disulfide bond formation protein B [Minisyncoccota bacterium]
MIQEFATPVITGATVLSHVVFVIFLFLYVTQSKFKEGTSVFVKKYIDELIFLFSFTAFAGSLVYSNIIGFPPCELCWVQRIFIYPQVAIAFVSMWRKEKLAVYYALPLSIIGSVVALYHSFVLWGGGSILPCTAEGGACAKAYVMEYGYITIPVMSLTLFLYLLTVTYIYKK